MKIKNLIVLFTTFSICIVYIPRIVSTTVAEASTQNISQRYIVKLKDPQIKDELKKYLTQSDITRVINDPKWVKVNVSPANALKLKADKNVLSIEKEKVRSLLTTPNDSLYQANGDYINGVDDQWNLKKINLKPVVASSGTSGWEITTGSTSTVIAIIDTGVDISHPDLSANIWTNPNEVGAVSSEGIAPNCTSRSLPLDKSCNNLDNDSNGYKSDYHGWNFVDENNNVQDTYGHGTHVAGTIAAVSNNSTGVAGICWLCKIMPLKVVNSQGFAYDTDIASAIRYAADNGAKIINMSLGGPGYTQIMQDAINYAITKNVLIVSASGNSGTSASNSYPGGFLNSMSIGASDYTDGVASFSNTGSKVDIVAPGVNVLSTKMEPNSAGCVGDTIYVCMSGTSMASPHVAGVAGLLVSLHPNWSLYQIRNALVTGAQTLGISPFDTISGFGRLDALSSLQKTQIGSGTVPTVSLNSPSPAIKGSYNVLGSVNSANLYIYMLNIKDSNGNIQTQWSGRSNISNSTIATIDTTVMTDGNYTLELIAQDATGINSPISRVSIITDNSTPTSFTASSPISGFINQAKPSFSWAASKASSVVTYTLMVDNVQIATNIASTSYSITSNLSEGNHSWYVIATSQVGKTNSSNVSNFGIDITAPSSPNTGVSVSGSNVTIIFGSTDSGSGISYYDLSVNSATPYIVTSPYILNSMADGQYTATIRAVDGANNINSSSVAFTVNSRTIYLTSKADLNHDGIVNISDLSILAQNWQTNSSNGDVNGDGIVNISDLGILAQNWQHSY